METCKKVGIFLLISLKPSIFDKMGQEKIKCIIIFFSKKDVGGEVLE